MVSPTTWAYIILSWITTIISIGLTVALFNNFLRKKTAGTIILTTSYLFTAVGAIIGAVAYTLQAFTSELIISEIFLAIATVSPIIALLLIYIFSCRHIIRDNDIAKSLTLMISSAILGFIFITLLFGTLGITVQTNPDAWYYLEISYVTTELYNISILVPSIFIIFLQVYINARIFGRAFVLSNRTDKLLRKRGLQMIAWGLVIYLLAGLIISAEILIENQTVTVIFWLIRKMTFLVSYVLLYIGWIMPDWFRRRLRGKTWFEMRYKEISKFVQK